MDKQGVSIVIGVVLLVMIVIVTSTAAYYWLIKVQGGLQAETESSQSELLEQVSGELEIKSFEHIFNSTTNLANITIIMQNAGSRDLEDLGSSKDLLVLSSEIHSCTAAFNSSSCNVCPFDLGAGAIKAIKFNLTNTDCANLNPGKKYDTHFALGDAEVHTSFTSNIAHS